MVNNRIKFFTFILSGSVLYSALVIWYSAPRLIPHKKFSCFACSFLVHPVSVISSPFSDGAMSMLCSRLQNCRNLSCNCLGANTEFPSVALASRLGTFFIQCFVIRSLFQLFKNWLTAPCSILRD